MEVEAFLLGAAARGERFDGVFASHLVEHLPADHVPGLVERIAAVLSPGGRAVLVTPNARNLVVLTETFWLDPTHVRPWPRPLLGRLVGLVVHPAVPARPAGWSSAPAVSSSSTLTVTSATTRLS